MTMTMRALVLAALTLIPAAATAQDVGLDIGVKPAAVSLPNLDGVQVDLARFIGKKPMMVEFWATWCELCEELQPSINRAHAKYGKQVEFVTVAVGVNQSIRSIKRHVEKHPVPGHLLWDGDGKAVRAFMAPATSYVVILDALGRVVYTGSGGDQKLEPVLARVSAPAR